MIREAIIKIVDKQDLTYDEAYQVMNEIMSGQTSPTQNAAFLAALSTKSTKAETVDEIAGCAAAMRDHAMKVPNDLDLLEIVGTGGDGAHSFNISTTSALVAAAGGVKVAKHGNRAASSSCGTADCLEALGVNLDLSPEKCLELLNTVGICFFFAQKYHTSMRYVGAIRKELGIRTVFNILGPLTNPAAPKRQVLGCMTSRWWRPWPGCSPAWGCAGAWWSMARTSWTSCPSAPPPPCASLRAGTTAPMSSRRRSWA